MNYSMIEGYGDLIRDSSNNSIININKTDYEQYTSRRETKNKESEKMQMIENDVVDIKNEINEIKSLLKELLNGSR